MKHSAPKSKPKSRLMKTKTVKPAKSNSKRSPANLWHLRLYVAGQTPCSVAAISNLKKLCEDHITKRYRIEVIDLVAKPQLSEGDRILAIPTLVRKLPRPMRKIVGDLSDIERVLVGLDLRPVDRPRRASVRASKASRATKAVEQALANWPMGKYIVRLYVAGATQRSRQAVRRVRQLCEAEFKQNFELEVIDVHQQPILARDGQIVATATLVKEFPPPVRRLIGKLSNTLDRFVGLNVDTSGDTARRKSGGLLRPVRRAKVR